MIYKETKKHIFSEIGKRVHVKKDELNLSYYQLAGYENKDDYDGYNAEKNKDPRNTTFQLSKILQAEKHILGKIRI